MTIKIMEAQYEVLWPLGRKAVKASRAASRLSTLSGKTVGELWDHRFRGDVVYPMVREHLRTLYPDIKFIEYPVFGDFHGPQSKKVLAELSEKLRANGCDAIISGIGA
jgi:hypothetical protein